MTIEDLEQLKADGMIDDRKYQQLKSKISMQGYQPGQQVAPSNAYDMTNYGKNLQAQAEPIEQNFNPSFGYDERNAKIAQLEQQIAMVKERIVRNERALTGKSYEDANKKLATLEMDKIGVRLNRQPAQSDPTMLWRWNQGRLDTMNANASQDAKTSAAWQKDANYVMSAEYDNSNDASMVQAQNNIRKMIEEGRLIGKSTKELAPLYDKLNEIQNDRNNLSVTTRKDTIIKDIQTTISEGALTTSINDIEEAYNSGIIDKRDVEKLKIRLNEKANQVQDQHEQRKQAKYNWNRTVKQNKEADAKKGDEQYFDGVFGGK